MATVKVKLRPSSVQGKAETIYYQVTHRRIIRQITTDIHIRLEDWDQANERIKPASKDRSVVQNRIDGDVSILQRIIKDMDDKGVPYSAMDIVKRYKSSDSHISVLDFMREQIDRLQKANRFGTASNYEKTMRSFCAFLDGINLPFSAMTEQLISEYNIYLLRRGVVRNSISFYMRILRAVYNRAVKQHLVIQTYPFQEVYTGIDRTRKRAVGETVISRLFRLDLQRHASLELARDLFIFSYCTRGMAFVDMAYLRKTDIRNGNICYARHKTKQQLCIRIEANIQQLIDRYVGTSSVYVFPILKTEDSANAFSQYKIALNNYNRHLSRLSEMLNLEYGLSSYTARHSWATAARNHNIPISVISAGMGHSSERTTQIYLTTLENSKIDSANQIIIECI